MIGLIYDVQPEFAEYVGNHVTYMQKADAAGCLDADEYLPAGSMRSGPRYRCLGHMRHLADASWCDREATK